VTAGTRPIAVIGPTASGKSDLALDLAEHLDGDIVNVDAMQQYRSMDIGTAKVPVDERRGIAHHQIDVLDVTETATVARYQEAARGDIESLIAAGRTPVVVGGSMMYIQALLDDWNFPATDATIRQRHEDDLARIGTKAMHAQLATVDPEAAEHILDTDGRRIVRALEVVELTGRPFAASAPTIGEPRWNTTVIALDRDTADLDDRIRRRTDAMFASGLVDEVEHLITLGLRDGVTAARAIGYAQVIAAIDGEYNIDRARELTFTGTRRYVRRQRSWFRRDPRIHWVDASTPDLVSQALRAAGR
jgi:tRNA dimethylallyltransferase